MSQRQRDTTLASNFTQTKHRQPTRALDPQTNKLPKPLNVLIIGASRGIGEGIAHAYARAGACSLFLAARPSSAQELSAVEQRAKKLNPTISTTCFAVDITSSESVASLAQRVKETVSRLDIVVLNSGYSGPVVLKVDEGNPQDFQDVFDVNVQGTYLVAHHFIPLLKESDGAKTFIAVGSFAACIMNGHIANTAYCISKFAQARLVEFLSEQYGQEGVLAVAVHPGAVNTEMANKTTPDSFRPYLTDDVGLCGAFCVWLSREKKMWLNGRLLSATWDVSELLEKKNEIEEQDLLKFGYRVSD
ncbi:NAD(P)-binding protein [Cucurbitaria berberidis CBS 394.84]|uniref:NAD(P)-binding protein n=1 Tax=Cucurbitaria berberidis CBS 394.84 TaxID=1168544 RepID=A0A9P4GQX6_9PLEO|nr:NAD(P)-binding protein [Cucurbitaria berberidis CBS 394.84]KAF1851073.1 NAD(P)-binding protein [Cucurbitaria berberidis CBS 394.84]